MRTHDSRVSSLAWDPCSSLLSSGSQSGVIHNYDARMAQFHRNTLKAHTLDVCGLRWAPNGRFLASGGNDNVVNIWDTYSQDPWQAPAHTFKEHTAAVKVYNAERKGLKGILNHNNIMCLYYNGVVNLHYI